MLWSLGGRTDRYLFVRRFVFFKQKTAYEMRISDWSSDVCSSDLPLDVALSGDGYFEVETPVGPRYTRNGVFQLNADRQLVTSTGLPVLGEGGTPITMPPNSADVTITRDGHISTHPGPAGGRRVARFDNAQATVKPARGAYAAKGLG